MKQINTMLASIDIKNVKARTPSLLLPLLLLANLTACDSIPFIDNSSDYKGAGRSRPLEVPPDLTTSPTSDTYSIPGGTSYSTYSQAQDGQEAGVEKVLQSPDGVRLEKSGGQSWLVVNAPAEKIWPVIRDFWIDMGFAVRVENPQIGLMETEWIESDAIKKEQSSGNVLNKFDKWLDKLSGFADRKKIPHTSGSWSRGRHHGNLHDAPVSCGCPG
jgi:outer membrane protein assembly factor BamC